MKLGVLSWKIPRLALAGPLLAVIALSASLGVLAPHGAEALDSEEQSFLGIINDYRAQDGLAPLALNDTLDGVARWMANDLGVNNYFSHTDSLGRDPFQRMDEMGYDYNTWRGENLVAGTETAPYAFQMWKDSPGHSANMLGAHYTVIGIARVYTASSNYSWYWATEFGGDSGAPPPAPTAPPPVYQPATAPSVTYPPTPAPVRVTAAPTQTDVPTPQPTPEPTASPEPVFPREQTAWWHALDAVATDWDFALFARQLMNLAPSLEQVFVKLVAGA